MEDCWLQQEEFDFDIPLSPLSGEHAPAVENSPAQNDDEDEVFFGPVGHMERCAAAVAKKEDIDPMMPLAAEQQALLLQESVALSVMLKHKPLKEFKTNSPVAVVFPIMKRESSNLSIQELKELKSESKNKENFDPQKTTNTPIMTSNMDNVNKSAISKSSDSSNKDKDNELSRKIRRASFNQPNKLNNSFGSEKLKQSGIPKVADQKSRIARPSSIPSFKQNLLSTQPKLKTQANQESKIKPLKALHVSLSNTTQQNLIKPQISNSQLSTSSKSTPVMKNLNKKNVGMDDAAHQRLKSIGYPSSLSKVAPKGNSTPIRASNNSQSSKKNEISKLSARKSISKSHITPRRSISDIKIGAVKDQQKTSERRHSARRSLLPRQMRSSNDESPISNGAIKRRSLSRTSLDVSISSSLRSYGEHRKGDDLLQSTNSLARSDTFVISKCFKNDNSLIDIPINNDNIEHKLNLNCNEQENGGQMELCPSNLDTVSQILEPETAVRHQSPLLKFDSPISKKNINDPFASGDTPPITNSSVLCPVQVQKDLIEF